MIDVTLYTKDGCHLCEQVAGKLSELKERYPHRLTTIDITEEDAVFQEYRYAIPVVHIGGMELRAPIAEEELVEALRAVGQRDP